MSLVKKEQIEEIQVQWHNLWRDKLDDRFRAEAIASDNYSRLFIEKGTVVHATRQFRALSFKDILDQNQIKNAQRSALINPQTGGWTKFIKTSIRKNRPERHALSYVEPEREKQQLKKAGRGWLHK